MRTVQITGSLVAAIGFLAGCSERSATTAPSVRAAAATPAAVIVDRPYTWSVKCSGDYSSVANWSWTTGGVPIVGTAMSVTCYPSSSPISGAGTRPATADGLSACVNPYDGDGTYNNSCKTWTFDPASSFKTQLKGTRSYEDFTCAFSGGKNCTRKASGTLTVDS